MSVCAEGESNSYKSAHLDVKSIARVPINFNISQILSQLFSCMCVLSSNDTHIPVGYSMSHWTFQSQQGGYWHRCI